MPRVRPLGKTDYLLIFKGKIRGAREELFMDRKAVAEKTGCSYGTVKNYENEPQKIPLGWLKQFIKATNMDPNIILNYLYEGKYKVQEKEDWRSA